MAALSATALSATSTPLSDRGRVRFKHQTLGHLRTWTVQVTDNHGLERMGRLNTHPEPTQRMIELIVARRVPETGRLLSRYLLQQSIASLHVSVGMCQLLEQLWMIASGCAVNDTCK